MKKRYSLTVHGSEKTWGFTIDAEPNHVEDWRADGLVVDELLNTMPEWIPFWAVKPWCFVQDVFYFRNPWKG